MVCLFHLQWDFYTDNKTCRRTGKLEIALVIWKKSPWLDLMFIAGVGACTEQILDQYLTSIQVLTTFHPGIQEIYIFKNVLT